jgi:hypothetical protein
LAGTDLAIYPFLREIVGHLVASALGKTLQESGLYSPREAASQSLHSDTPKRLSLFSGHDSVIAPVLAALGIYEGPLCLWPGYASRIVFELWRHKDAGRTGAAVMSGAEWGTYRGLHSVYADMIRVTKDADHSAYAHSFVRVFYNGQDVTQLIPECKAERLEHTSGSVRATVTGLLSQVQAEGASLCSLEALTRRVGALLQGRGATLTEACTDA